jgi:hypothetical protein
VSRDSIARGLEIESGCAGIKFLMMSGDDVDGASRTNTLHLHIGLQDAEKASDDVRPSIIPSLPFLAMWRRVLHNVPARVKIEVLRAPRNPPMTSTKTTPSLRSTYSGRFRAELLDFLWCSSSVLTACGCRLKTRHRYVLACRLLPAHVQPQVEPAYDQYVGWSALGIPCHQGMGIV